MEKLFLGDFIGKIGKLRQTELANGIQNHVCRVWQSVRYSMAPETTTC